MSKTHIAHDLLSRAYSPDTADQLFTERIKQKPLYLRPTSPTPADNRSRRRLQRIRKKEYFYRKQRPRPLSAREKRISGFYGIPKEECKYEVFKGLHDLWVAYMQEVLGIEKQNGNRAPPVITAQGHGNKLVSADYHGAEVEVVRSRCAGRVGAKGIVVRDTKFTFVIVTEKNVVKTIPKEHTVFRFAIPAASVESKTDDEDKPQEEKPKDLVFELHGSQFENRPVDRANKKFKWRNIDYV
ncbi:ribonuclease P complex subunit Pop4, putative [Talaromyces stipitatus ATCC 10500]|uniref:Ribonuclease P protein subunit n=1 Tax=Talaromyces stipitatus (strain ATCC 10500 / CBS 375.48 / QM 6759 / NRRL 1006) TaxID=441959 RepID=B8LSY4_TALSN|nr:ribonuclease P complex subunit Pop4, putative [Talaromyces stipitatus ATCC 10500]EED22980.1 ribonuclease P complex subunit Pop4, putative [Talaromyces stipitatus ATCC 10500]